MAEDLKAKIVNTHTIPCYGVPTNSGLAIDVAASAFLTARVDGTVEVRCPHYNRFNERYLLGESLRGGPNKGTCRASEQGNGTCTYIKLKADSEV